MTSWVKNAFFWILEKDTTDKEKVAQNRLKMSLDDIDWQLQQTKMRLGKRIQLLEAENVNVKGLLSRKIDEAKGLYGQVSLLKLQLEEITQAKADDREQQEESRKIYITMLREQLHQLNEDKIKMELLRGDFNNANTDLQYLKLKVDKLAAASQALEKTNSELSAATFQLLEEKSLMEINAKCLQAKLTEVEAKLEDKEAENAAFKQRFEKLKQQLKSAAASDKELKKQNAEFIAINSRLLKQNRDMEMDTDCLHAKITDVEAKLADLEAENKVYEIQLETLTKLKAEEDLRCEFLEASSQISRPRRAGATKKKQTDNGKTVAKKRKAESTTTNVSSSSYESSHNQGRILSSDEDEESKAKTRDSSEIDGEQEDDASVSVKPPTGRPRRTGYRKVQTTTTRSARSKKQ